MVFDLIECVEFMLLWNIAQFLVVFFILACAHTKFQFQAIDCKISIQRTYEAYSAL